MKVFRIIIAVFAVVLLSFAWFNAFKTAGGDTKEYQSYISEGDIAFEKTHYQEAYIAYEKALNIKPNEALQNKIIEAYRLRYEETSDYTDLDSLMTAYSGAVSRFPKNTEYYENLMRMKMSDSQYNDAMKTYNAAKSNGAVNDEINKLYEQLLTVFSERRLNITEIKYADNGFYIGSNGGGWRWIKDNFKTTSNQYYTVMGPVGDDKIFFSVDPEGKAEFLDTIGIVRGKVKDTVTEAGMYSEGKTPVRIKDNYSYIDLDGNVLFGSYAYAGTFKNGRACVQNDNEKWIIIDSEGKQVSSLEFDDVVTDLYERCAIGEKRDKIIAKKDGKYRIYDLDLSNITGELPYEYVGKYTNDRIFAVRTGGKYGFADMDGKVIIEPSFEDAKSFSNGLAAVKADGYWSLIARSGKTVINGKYTEMLYVDASGRCPVIAESSSGSRTNTGYSAIEFKYFDLLRKGL